MNVHVDFVVAGFSKCGSTTLCALLDRHPEIHMGRVKESNYFGYCFEHGPEWYEEMYSARSPGQIVGDGSVGYATGEFANVAATRIAAHSPDARFLFIARDPITRLEASFREMHHSGWVYGVEADRDIGVALQRLPNMLADTKYWDLLNAFRARFADRRFHFIFQEDLARDPAAVMRACFEFLDVDPEFAVPGIDDWLNVASEKLYDSRLMKYIRRSPAWSRRWQWLAPENQERLGRLLRLRRPFRGPVSWPADALARVEAALADDSRQYLGFTGRPLSDWPWVERHSRNSVASGGSAG